MRGHKTASDGAPGKAPPPADRLAAVITTIQPPTRSVSHLVSLLLPLDTTLFVIGDGKGPASYPLPATEFWSLGRQLTSPFELARHLPVGHYARKNIGYLAAIASGATVLYETDDDNAPLPTWRPRSAVVLARAVAIAGWVNAYRFFSDALLWPRGFPLGLVKASCQELPPLTEPLECRAPIQQGLASGSPDVDAIWRLVLDRPIDFHAGPSIRLRAGGWCPFNSQSTWWWPEAFPLLYLPTHCSFRMTDIWRSFVAQRCLWELDAGIVFHTAEVLQERNEHDLMRDLVDELPGYTRNAEIARVLEGVSLESGEGAVADNLLRCYEALVAHDVFPAAELHLVRCWIDDLASLTEACAPGSFSAGPR